MTGRFRALVTATLLVGGCAAPPASPHQLRPISTSLVMPSAAQRGPAASDSGWPVAADRWEYGRNDEALGAPPAPANRKATLVRIRTRDDQRTVNGRPRESSSTTTRTDTYRLDY